MPGTSPNPALDGESRVTEIIAILSVTTTLSTLIVVLRCYTRAFILKSFGPDDVVMVPAQALTIAAAVAIGLETKYGLGRHYWTVPDEHYIPYMKAFYSSIIVYNIAVCLTKISILLLYRRVFSNTTLNKILLVGLMFLSAWGITLCFLLPLVCVPVSAFWDPTHNTGHCLNSQTIWYVMAGVNVTTDFALFMIPIPIIQSLHLPLRQKLLLLCVFTMGVFPCAVAIYRIHTLYDLSQSSDDPTWDNVDAATFSMLELTVGIMATCLPTIRPILIRALPKIFASNGSLNVLPSSHGNNGRSGVANSRFSRRDARTGFKGLHSNPSRSPSRPPSPYKLNSDGGRDSASNGRLGLHSSISNEALHSYHDSRKADDLGPLSIFPRNLRESDHDIEMVGELKAAPVSSVDRLYSVSVVGGYELRDAKKQNKKHDQELNPALRGITTTTIVTQHISFTGSGEERNWENGRRLIR